MTSYITREGDALDWICWRHYGHRDGALEATLNANPGLADHGPVLPGGLTVILPALSAPATHSVVRLWS